MVGASSGNTTARINANWRTAFMSASTLHPHLELHKVPSLGQVWAQTIFTHPAKAANHRDHLHPQIPGCKFNDDEAQSRMVVALASAGERSGVCCGLRCALWGDCICGLCQPHHRHGSLSWHGVPAFTDSTVSCQLSVVSALCQPYLQERLDISSESSCA